MYVYDKMIKKIYILVYFYNYYFVNIELVWIFCVKVGYSSCNFVIKLIEFFYFFCIGIVVNFGFSVYVWGIFELVDVVRVKCWLKMLES